MGVIDRLTALHPDLGGQLRRRPAVHDEAGSGHEAARRRARETTIRATSSGVPSLPAGCMRCIDSRDAEPVSRPVASIGVVTAPGRTQLTRIAWANSMARARVRATRPPFEAA
jgi:hypothetical protein